jgi:GTP-binding protein YchF
MGFNCGIVGLPNVGKSTLFNALTATAAAAAENYPFCTIEPNVGRVIVPDPRLETLAMLAKSERIVPTQLEFVDIAGLVKGASSGEGLGNKFLSHIREVDAIVHVLRCFGGDGVHHVEGTVDPVRDAETVETELMLADLESVERRFDQAEKKAKGADAEARVLVELLGPAVAALRQGKPARTAAPAEPEKRRAFQRLGLITAKPILYMLNVDEASAATGNDYSQRAAARAAQEGAESVVISAAIEAEIAQLSDPVERTQFLATLGLEEPGLDRFIRAGYALLGLITFFTAGPKETRAWTVPKGATAPEAAGAIHTDFERGFIRAETISYADYVKCGGEQGAKDAGRMRQEGRDYTVQDGDVMLFRFNI